MADVSGFATPNLAPLCADRDRGPAGSQTGMPSLPTVTVCIPAYDESRNIGKLLKFLRKESDSFGRLIQVLVDASGSSDGSQEIVRALASDWPLIQLIDIGRRDGLVHSMNRLLAMSEGEIIVRLDADVSMSPGVLGTLLRALETPGTGIVGPRIVGSASGDGIIRALCDTQFALHDLISRQSPKTTNVQVFRHFPFQFPPNAESEDNVLQKEIINRGLRPLYVQNAVVKVASPSRVSELFSWRIRCIATSRWYRDCYGEPSPTQNLGVVVAAMIQGIRTRRVAPMGLVLFLALEALCQISVSLSSLLHGAKQTSEWTPLSSTKSPPWSVQDGADVNIENH